MAKTQKPKTPKTPTKTPKNTSRIYEDDWVVEFTPADEIVWLNDDGSVGENPFLVKEEGTPETPAPETPAAAPKKTTGKELRVKISDVIADIERPHKDA